MKSWYSRRNFVQKTLFDTSGSLVHNNHEVGKTYESTLKMSEHDLAVTEEMFSFQLDNEVI